MSKKTTYTTYKEIETEIDVDIILLNSHIYTTKDLSEIDKQHKTESEKLYLCITIEIELDDFESVLDAAAYARPRLLIILGILSFLTQELFTPFDFIGSYTVVGILKNIKTEKFLCNKIDLLTSIEMIIQLVNSKKENDKRLLYSLIDRYRKAFYLEQESEENMIHDDEILLSYFHILELLSNKYYSNQKQKATNSINDFTESILKEIYLLDGSQLESELNAKKKLIENLLISNIPVGSKIMYMFEEQGILTLRLKYFISELIKDRNSVAHGRQVYQERVIFPIPPFFPLIRNREYSFEMLRILTGRAISLFLNMNHLKNEWEEIDESLMPTIDELNIFIKEKKYESLSIDEFFAGIENDIVPFSISYYLINNKLIIEKAIQSLSNVIENYREVEEEITQIILAVILIADKTEGKLREKCIEIIKIASANRWLPDFKIRDVLYYLEYLGHQPKILREMISNKEIK
ncbi:hypothetical protein [Flavobacterium sp. W20_MBD1_R3]|uniref:hypothetical protein n=1 Tax=Flavobacterium sp. W20_MBD1_R3 TaxID=3240278 RepID=UPI003F92EEA2